MEWRSGPQSGPVKANHNLRPAIGHARLSSQDPAFFKHPSPVHSQKKAKSKKGQVTSGRESRSETREEDLDLEFLDTMFDATSLNEDIARLQSRASPESYNPSTSSSCESSPYQRQHRSIRRGFVNSRSASPNPMGPRSASPSPMGRPQGGSSSFIPINPQYAIDSYQHMHYKEGQILDNSPPIHLNPKTLRLLDGSLNSQHTRPVSPGSANRRPFEVLSHDFSGATERPGPPLNFERTDSRCSDRSSGRDSGGFSPIRSYASTPRSISPVSDSPNRDCLLSEHLQLMEIEAFRLRKGYILSSPVLRSETPTDKEAISPITLSSSTKELSRRRRNSYESQDAVKPRSKSNPCRSISDALKTPNSQEESEVSREGARSAWATGSRNTPPAMSHLAAAASRLQMSPRQPNRQAHSFSDSCDLSFSDRDPFDMNQDAQYFSPAKDSQLQNQSHLRCSPIKFSNIPPLDLELIHPSTERSDTDVQFLKSSPELVVAPEGPVHLESSLFKGEAGQVSAFNLPVVSPPVTAT